MGFGAEWQLAGCMKRGSRGSGYPRGYLSEPRPCPYCGKQVKGRSVGMIEHMRVKHAMDWDEAQTWIDEAGITWSTEEEMRAAVRSNRPNQSPSQKRSDMRAKE